MHFFYYEYFLLAQSKYLIPLLSLGKNIYWLTARCREVIRVFEAWFSYAADIPRTWDTVMAYVNIYHRVSKLSLALTAGLPAKLS